MASFSGAHLGPFSCVYALLGSSCFYKDISPLGSQSTLMTSFDHNYFFKGPIFKCSHMGVRAST